jgi:hypothetical protein
MTQYQILNTICKARGRKNKRESSAINYCLMRPFLCNNTISGRHDENEMYCILVLGPGPSTEQSTQSYEHL